MDVAPGGSMLVKGRSTTALCLSVMSFLFTPAIAKQESSGRPGRQVSGSEALTCDSRVLDVQSYEMSTIGQARALRVNSHIATPRDLNLDAQDLAERAAARDRRNMMAHSILARQYTILGWDREAIGSWGQVISSGGAVVWTATLYDVDYKSYFLLAFSRDAVRIYRMGQFTGPVDRRLGYATFPEPTEVAFYEAAAGCPDPSIAPAATVPWSDVREVRSGNWVLWFKLGTPVTIVSDRNRRKTLREIKVNLHGETGDMKILAERNPDFDGRWGSDEEPYKNVRGIGLGPWDYNRRTRDMILRFAEPSGHIKRTSAGKGAGW